MDDLTIRLITLAGLAIPSAIVAWILEARRLSESPESRTYAWGYFQGCIGLLSGALGLVLMIAGGISGNPTWFGTGALFAALYGVPGFFVMRRRRWAWIILTIAMVNPISWIINGIYARNRWSEFGLEADARVRAATSGSDQIVRGPQAAPDESTIHPRRRSRVSPYAWGLPALFLLLAVCLWAFASRQSSNRPWNAIGDRVHEKLSSDWVEFVSPTGGFRATFPRYPVQANSTGTIPGSNLSFGMTSYTSVLADGSSFLVQRYDYPDEVDMSNPLARLDGAINGMLAATSGSSLLSSSRTAVDGHPGVDVVIVAKGITMNARCILIGQTMFTILAAPTGTEYTRNSYARFLESFRLL